MITPERLRQVLRYEPATGTFYWIARLSNRTKIGDEAGNPIDGYVQIAIDGRPYRAHRLAWMYVHGVMPEGILDHKNGNRSDNRISNLRIATRRENVGNARRPRHNKSGVKGVYWDAGRGKWHAQIQRHGRSTSLGRFDSIQAASQAYRAAAVAEFGDFARFE